METEYIQFNKRHVRAKYISQRFEKYLSRSVLDVGCWERDLKGHLGESANYFGIDVSGDPDQVVNLEQVERLPFDDNSYDTIVCTDVLEHLDNLHNMFNELLRVGSKHIILSLPNCWSGARVPIERGRGQFAHYGLPFERPVDRHKWFICASEIIDFTQHHAQEKGIKITEQFVTEKPRPALIRAIRKMRYNGGLKYANRYSNTVWTVFEKQ